MSKKHKLLVLTSTFPLVEDDAEPPFVYELCRRLVADFRVIVIAPASVSRSGWDRVGVVRVYRYRYAPRGWQRLAYAGGLIPTLRRSPALAVVVPGFLAALVGVTWKLAWRWRPEVIHCHWIFPQGWAAAVALALLRGTRPRLMMTAHGADLYALRGGFFNGLLGFALGRADSISVVSRAMRNDLLARFPFLSGSAVWVRSMGVDAIHRFVPSEAAPTDDAPLLFVGRLVAKKGLPIVLGALAELRGEGIRCRLDVIGDGPLRDRWEALATDLGLADQVCFLGPQPNRELAAHYRRALAVVMPSVVAGGDQEGLGLVAVEAMACGAVVVASDLPALREVIPDSSVGHLFPPGDSVQLAQLIRRLLSSAKQLTEMRQRARERAVECFDWSQVAADYRKWLASGNGNTSDCGATNEGRIVQ